MENDIVKKINQIDEELNPFYPHPKTHPIRMLQCGAVSDTETMIFTKCLASCVGLAISAIDSTGQIHRIVTHNPYTGEGITKRHEDAIEEYLKSLPPIKELKAIICSMDRFSDLNNLEDEEQEILARINNIFAFYKETHPDFYIPFHRSWFIKVLPNGDFEYAAPEMIDIYRQMEEEYVENLKKKL